MGLPGNCEVPSRRGGSTAHSRPSAMGGLTARLAPLAGKKPGTAPVPCSPLWGRDQLPGNCLGLTRTVTPISLF